MPLMHSLAHAHASIHQRYARATTTTSSTSTATASGSSSTTAGVTSSSNIVLTHKAIIWISCSATLATIAFVVVVLLLCTGVFDTKKKGSHEYGGVLDDRNMYTTWNPDAPLSDEAFESGLNAIRDRHDEDDDIAMTPLTSAASPIAGSPLSTPPRGHSPAPESAFASSTRSPGPPQNGFLGAVDEVEGMPGTPGRRAISKRPRPQTKYYNGGWRESIWGRAVGNRISMLGRPSQG